jgi:hypothetical protein
MYMELPLQHDKFQTVTDTQRNTPEGMRLAYISIVTKERLHLPIVSLRAPSNSTEATQSSTEAPSSKSPSILIGATPLKTCAENKTNKKTLHRYPAREYTPVARRVGPDIERPLPAECRLAAPPGTGPAHSPPSEERIWLHARPTKRYGSPNGLLATPPPASAERRFNPRKRDRRGHGGTYGPNFPSP